MVTSSAVVGSSAISSFGLAGERHRDHHPLAHAAGELVRVGVAARAPASGMPTCAEQLDRALARRARGGTGCAAARLADLRADRAAPGSSDVIGSWKIIAISAPRTARSSRSARPPGRAPRSPIDPPSTRAPVGQQAQHRERGDRLAAARLADDAERAAAPTRRLTPSTAPHDAARRPEPGVQVAHVEHRGHAAVPHSSASRGQNAAIVRIPR